MNNVLSDSLARKQLSHAIILETGPDTARVFIDQFINAVGISPADYLLFEPSQALKIKEARQITDFLSRSRFGSDIKLVFIPNAELMTTEAANALLKTLEEPPVSAHIILATSQVEKLLPTVRSRCQLHHFIPQTQTQVPTTLPNTLPELFELSKQITESEQPLAVYLSSLAQTRPTLARLVVTYLPHCETNVNRRLLLDNFFLELYTKG